MVAIFPNVCLCRRSLWSNLSGIDLEKLYRVEPLSYAITAYVVASYGPRFFSTVLKKFGQLARRFWQMVYRRPPPPPAPQPTALPKCQPRNHYHLSTINQLFLPNPNSTSFATNENALRTDAAHIYLQHNT